MTFSIPFLIVIAVCIAGLIIFLLPSPPENPKRQRIGEIMFGFGLLVILFALAAVKG